MKILIPRNAVAIAVDYRGDANMINAVRYYPEQNKIIPQFQLNTNPSSKDFGAWRQIGLARTQVNAQHFISEKTKTAKQIWLVTNDRRFLPIWSLGQPVVSPEEIQLAPEAEPEVVSPVEEAKDENQAG
ncbi:hypothetical protein HYQ27_gp071 [Salmonella phage Se-J]|uniref:hypothetical protein n=1 Tax=Salmonella phage Se-J TaxID=2698910 RepID=UPI0018AFA3DB|nr:hypothetical protein HYQ27_gp071 [Salmonella phage Se-J]